MADANFSIGLVGKSGIFPALAFLETDESYSEITQPGYINNVISAGYTIDENYFVLASYGVPAQLQIFTVDVNDGVYTLETYSPNENSFEFTEVQFVAKGGSDLNPGDKLGFPKETIQAAINDLSPPMNGFSLCYVVDSGSYEENVVLPPNVLLLAPNANITASSGAVLTLNDTGQFYTSAARIGGLLPTGGALAVDSNGPQTTLILDAPVIQGGDIDIEGTIYLNSLLVQFCQINIQATGQIVSDVQNPISSSLNGPGNLIGKFGSFQYGPNTFQGKMTYFQDELQEVAGRKLTTTDPISTIQYNNPSDGIYVLPQTSDVPISVGARVSFVQIGMGKIQFNAGPGATITSAAGANARTSVAGGFAIAEKLTDTLWVVFGTIEATP